MPQTNQRLDTAFDIQPTTKITNNDNSIIVNVNNTDRFTDENLKTHERLIVKEAYVGKGLVMKRFHARARGRGARIIKPFSHLTILLSEQEGS